MKTSIHCHECNKNFVAGLDHRIEGNHEIVCPFCGHYHYRKIENGKVTGDRWDSSSQTVQVPAQRIWKHDALAIRTSCASDFIWEAWVNTLT